MVPIKIKKLLPDAQIPKYQTEQAAGMDLHACLCDGSVCLRPGERKLIPTGIAIQLPPGYEAQIRPRSGMALNHSVTVANAPGTIDADYRGEVGVILINHHPHDAFWISHGNRIAQMVIAPISVAKLVEVEELNETDRGSGGFSSTGK